MTILIAVAFGMTITGYFLASTGPDHIPDI